MIKAKQYWKLTEQASSLAAPSLTSGTSNTIMWASSKGFGSSIPPILPHSVHKASVDIPFLIFPITCDLRCDLSFTQWPLKASLQAPWPCHTLPGLSSSVNLESKTPCFPQAHIFHSYKPGKCRSLSSSTSISDVGWHLRMLTQETRS